MKIAYGGYPLMQLLGGEARKMARGRAKNDSLGPGDVTTLSVISDKAVVKYLKVVEEITSEITGITDSNIPLEDNEKVSPVFQGLAKRATIVPGDILMFLPGGASSGLEKTTRPGELVVIKDALSVWTEGLSEKPDENSLTCLAKDIAGRLSRLDAGMGMRRDSFATEVEGIVEKMAALSDAVNRLTLAEMEIGGAAADVSDLEAATRVPVKGAINGIVKGSLQIAVSHRGPVAAMDDTNYFGITVDEKGLLKFDRAVFTKALAGKRDETVGFIRDLAGSLHDRITYNFHPFAASYVGRQENAGLWGPIQKEARANEGQDERTTFEKRLNELQMLLKNSYELKESFMKRKSAAGDGRDEETK